MHRCLAALLPLSLLVSCVADSTRGITPEGHERPNFLVIVADDLGYSDLGVFGGEIATPNLDGIAGRGMVLTDFHTSPTCSPTRAMLLTGSDSHKVGLGAMAETPEAMKPHGVPGYEGFLTRRVATLAETLRQGGYFTAMAGKWHLGLEEGQSPADRGFEESFALLQGAHNHFGADQEGQFRTLGEYSRYRRNGVLARYPRGEYSSDYFASELIASLNSKRRSGRPFFAYLAFTAPHWPLQAPPAEIERYRGRYDMGPEALRTERLGRMRHMGLVHPTAEPSPIVGRGWHSLTALERETSARSMEVYAAMVDRLDQNVGRVLETLRRSGELDRTYIVFLSDNGAEGLPSVAPILRLRPGAADSLRAYNNRLENIGSASSFTLYGPEWAQASSPFRLYKGYTTEGGIRTPAFIAGPGLAAKRRRSELMHVMDIAPTIVALAGLPAQGAVAASSAVHGRSWWPWLNSRKNLRGPGEPLAWELSNSKAVRRGKWKAVMASSWMHGDAPEPWRLYDLANDPFETRDLAREQPEVLAKLVQDWSEYARSAGVQSNTSGASTK